MLFHSLEFILLFLPVVLLVYRGLESFNYLRVAIVWLILASLFFYAYWNWSYVFLLLGSIGINYLLGYGLIYYRSRLLLGGGIGLNLAVLGYYKYSGFFLENLSQLGFVSPQFEILLPLGISFFTFQQIAFLLDVYGKKIQLADFSRYALFISFFPQLIAGPIVHYQEIVPQMGKRRSYAVFSQDFQLGLSIFLIGLFKKFVIADSFAQYASPVFAQADALTQLDSLDAWRALLAYTFQIYFDFSGYSDMALGLARLFGLRLPLNFFSPYQASNISDFWRRWHITLSRFLRDYLYFSLGGARKGVGRTLFNLVLVMFLGGLWHGAGWNFVLWGLLHGLYLAVFHAFQYLQVFIPGQSVWQSKVWRPFGRVLSWLLTFLAVCLAWVFFRTETFAGAVYMFETLAQVNFSGFSVQAIDFGLLAILVLVLFFPNTWQLMEAYHPSVDNPPIAKSHHYLRWQFNLRWALFAGFLIGSIVIMMVNGQVTEFIYFQF